MAKFIPVDWKTLECIFNRAGFEFARQEGSHRSYVKAGISRPVVIIRNDLKTAGISREEYFELLAACR